MNNDIDLYQLAYLSRNRIAGDQSMLQAEIEDIVAKASRNNPALGITGALLYSGGFFCQVLEGPIENVEKLFATIDHDPRHDDVTILHFEPMDHRDFGAWGMTLAGMQDTPLFDLDHVLAAPDKLVAEATGHALVTALDSFLTAQQRNLAAGSVHP